MGMERTVSVSNLGYPRIGGQREWKKALEAFWAGKQNEQAFLAEMDRIRLSHLKTQQEKGIDWIPVNDFTLYDHMLDMAVMFGAIPKRFAYEGGPVSLATYFAMARGNAQATACEMTKWFNTNYHYIVPEIGGTKPVLTENKPLAAYRFAKSRAGIEGKPVVIGLYTFLKLSKGFAPELLGERLELYLPVYVEMLKQLEQEGVQWVQLDEPALVTDVPEAELELVERVYEAIRKEAPQLRIMLQTYFESVDHYERIIKLPVHGIGLDFVHGGEQNLRSLEAHGYPQDKWLGAGVIDGRNIWRSELESKLSLVETLAQYVPTERLVLQPSCSLLHVPVTAAGESKLAPALKEALAFADEKLDELRLLKAAVCAGKESVREAWTAGSAAVAAFASLPERNRKDVAEQLNSLGGISDQRTLPFAERVELQRDRWKLPPLPTTTIGSFPQTAEIRQNRLKWRKGEWSSERYEAFISEQIERWIRLQEEIGLDVLVHGEFERTDMVEFFGEKLAGFAFTANGWVQSYGSRCVKPPVIYGDVAFIEPMTVVETAFAQSLTSLPVKGMLTGPITILNWSFVRDDVSRRHVAEQIALSLRHEIAALEQAGIEMIQVDEPALREGLPLKQRDQDAYLAWAVRAFRIATSAVRDTTQIHTHMCYCEFHDMIDAIRALDADVISIETSRSHGELIESFELQGYDHGIGLGVYDIHSPRIPTEEEMSEMIDRALRVLNPDLFWINPDCGLKTRAEQETVPALRNMVAAARAAREQRYSTRS